MNPASKPPTAKKASTSSVAETDGDTIEDHSGTPDKDEYDDFVISAKRAKPSNRVCVFDSDDDDEITILD